MGTWVLVFGACVATPDGGEATPEPGPEAMEDGDPAESVEPNYHNGAVRLRPADPEPVDADIEPEEPDILDPNYDAFFAWGSIQQIRLEIDEASWAALDADPRTWARATFEHVNGMYGDIRLEGVGVHLKGSDTFQTLDQKPSLKIKFDEFSPGSVYAGLQRLTLNNMTGDPVMGSEVVSYRVWAQAGIPVPRATYAEVWINGEPYGLYTALETVDDEFLQKRFEADEGDLWEANEGAGLTNEGITHFALVSGPGDVSALERAVDAVSSPGDFWVRADEGIVVSAFVDYWTWCLLTGTKDGYPYNPNDFFLYGDPLQGGRFIFLPWGMDETWERSSTWLVPDPGTVGDYCLQDPDCRSAFRERLAAGLVAWEAMDIPGMQAEAFDVSADAMARDPRKPDSTSTVESERARRLDDLEQWPEIVRSGTSGL